MESPAAGFGFVLLAVLRTMARMQVRRLRMRIMQPRMRITRRLYTLQKKYAIMGQALPLGKKYQVKKGIGRTGDRLESSRLCKAETMKRIGCLFGDICKLENPYLAHLNASKGKRNRKEVQRFGADLQANIYQIQQESLKHTYTTGKYSVFVKYELKRREIYKLPYRDRVVQWAIMQILAADKRYLNGVQIYINDYLENDRLLHIKSNYQIFPVESRGIDFVGCVTRHGYCLARKRNKKALCRNSSCIAQERAYIERNTPYACFKVRVYVSLQQREFIKKVRCERLERGRQKG